MDILENMINGLLITETLNPEPSLANFTGEIRHRVKNNKWTRDLDDEVVKSKIAASWCRVFVWDDVNERFVVAL